MGRATLGVTGAAVTLLALAGCDRRAPDSAAPPSAPAVTLVAPTKGTVSRPIEQPGRVEAFEQTPIYAKIPGFVRKVHVDIGAHVHEGDLLAELWVPEMEEEVKKKEATIAQKEAEVEQAKKMRDAAAALVRAEEAGRLRAQAEFDRAQSQHDQLVKSGGAIDKEAVSAARYGVESAKAAQAQVEAKVKAAEAARDKAVADIAVAEANLKFARTDRDQARATFGYARVTAPFEGRVSQRNVDKGHFLQPMAGGNKGEPLFVVVQADTVRVFVDVPEAEAGLVRDGMEAKVRVQSVKGKEFEGTVTRTSGVLDPKTRTLRTEIDLPNKDGTLLPGSYAYATLMAKHEGAFTLPAAAVVTAPEGAYCFRVEGGKAVKTPLQTGLSGGGLVEVLKKQIRPGAWEDVTGREEVAANAAGLKDGEEVAPR